MGIPSPDSKVHGANMGPIWGRQDPGGSHVGPMNFAIWVVIGFYRNPFLHMTLVIVIEAEVKHRKTSNISRTFVGNDIVDNSDVVGASSVGAAPTTSSFST